MKVLLDTQVWLWMLTAPDRLGEMTDLIADTTVTLLLSAASSWKIAIKYSIGRLPLPEAPATYVPSRINSTGVTALAIEHSHALEVASLPDHHRDPFDRLLVAQARVEGVPLVTSYAFLGRYPVDIRLLRG